MITDDTKKNVYMFREISDWALDVMRINLSVRLDKLYPEPACDFCGDPNPVVQYGSKVMSTGEVRSCWRWCACSDCHALITAHDADIIQKIAVRRTVRIGGLSFDLAVEGARRSVHTFLRYAETEDIQA